jgi:hypothetical protein
MSITSGGFARDPSLGIADVIERNSDFGSMARQALLNQHPELSEKDIILPSDLGKVKGWAQSDYLLFWFHTIIGLKVKQSRIISNKLSPLLSDPCFSDATMSTEDRWEGYEWFTTLYISYLREFIDRYGRDLKPNNIQAMIMILDGEMSLGCRAEEMLCRAVGIPPQLQFLDANKISEIDNFTVTTNNLRKLGAYALGLSINPSGMKFCGVSKGNTESRIAFGLGFRKTGLLNAIDAAQYYKDNPTYRPKRHHGHTPYEP